MADRDWDKELAKIDKQLGSLSDEQLLGPAPTAPAKGGKPAPAGKAAPALPAPRDTGDAKPTRTWAVYARLTISVAPAWGWSFGPSVALQCRACRRRRSEVVAAASGLDWTWRHRTGHARPSVIDLWG